MTSFFPRNILAALLLTANDASLADEPASQWPKSLDAHLALSQSTYQDFGAPNPLASTLDYDLIIRVKNQSTDPVSVPATWFQKEDNPWLQFVLHGKELGLVAGAPALKQVPGTITIGPGETKSFVIAFSFRYAFTSFRRNKLLHGACLIHHAAIPDRQIIVEPAPNGEIRVVKPAKPH